MLRAAKDFLRWLLLQRLRWSGGYAAVVTAENALFGRRLRVEACSACQLACPSCTTAQGHTKTGVVGWGALEAASFRRLLETSGRVRTVELSNWGEIFLNNELPEILRIAHERGVAVEVMNGVNLNHAREASLEAVVRYGVRRLSVSIDGATQDAYETYRRKGDLERVLAHVDRINHHKRALGSRWPELVWQFIVFGHNEHEIEAARRMAEARGMRFHPIRNLDFEYSPVKDPQAVKRATGIDVTVPGDAVVDGVASRLDYCHQLWDAPQVNWDGQVLGCCFNNWATFGNALKTGLDAALASERYRHTQRFILGRAEPRPDTPCLRCPVLVRAPKSERRVVPIVPVA